MVKKIIIIIITAIQRFNAALFRETFAWHDDPDR